MYIEWEKVAKITGRLLAHSLMLRYPFKYESISLVGFSLGTQVVSSCLQELHKYNKYDIIQNVTMLAGATDVKVNASSLRQAF